MTFEEQILSYMDGTLDVASSEELLHTLSVSPEKRALFEEHLRLNSLVAMGQKGFQLPRSLEATLASRIPAIEETLTQPVGFWAARSHAIGSMLSAAFRTPARSVAIAASAAIVVTVAAMMLTWTAQPTKIASTEASNSPTAVVQHELGNRAGTLHNNTNAQIGSDLNRSVVSAGGSVELRDAVRGAQNIAVASEDIHHADRAVRGSNSAASREKMLPVANVENHVAHDNAVRSNSLATPVVAQSIASIEHSVDGRDAENAIISPSTSQLATLRTVAVGTSTVARWSVAAGVSALSYTVPQVGTVSTAHATLPQIQVAYHVSPHVAIRAATGLAMNPTLTTSQETELPHTGNQVMNPDASYHHIEYATSTQLEQALLGEVGVSYYFAPMSLYPVQISLMGGATMGTQVMPSSTLSFGIGHALTSSLSLELVGSYQLIWGTVTPTVAEASTGNIGSPVGVQHANVDATRVFLAGYGVSTELRYHF